MKTSRSIRSLLPERWAAGLMLAAAIAGIIVANMSGGVVSFRNIPLDGSGLGIGTQGHPLTLAELISSGLLALFFFTIAVELKHEVTVGALNSPRKAALPLIAALGGVAVPAAIFLAFSAGQTTAAGWPIPTATDVAFALGALAIFGRGLPARIRVFLLALAVLDDLVAIIIIAVVFAGNVDWISLTLAAAAAAVFGALSRRLRNPLQPQGTLTSSTIRGYFRAALGILLFVLALVTWILVFRSGVHATIAGVVLGFVMARRPAERASHWLEPANRALILPLFAFSASLVVIPQIHLSDLDPAFWGIAVALPVGKLLGITLATALGLKILRPNSGVTIADSVVVGALGGIGFTVSLLMNELAFKEHPVEAQGTLAVLLGSLIAVAVSCLVVRLRVKSDSQHKNSSIRTRIEPRNPLS